MIMQKLIENISKYLEKDCKLANELEDIVYLELTKSEIIEYFDKVTSGINKWKEYLNNNKINLIVNEYKDFESIISELELCLIDYDELFNIRDISCSYYELGEKLVLYQKEVNKNVKQ